jgi:signal transduction histidine kinase
MASLYKVSPCGGEIYVTLVMPVSIAVQVLVGVCIALVLGRHVMRPLAAMSKAARQIANGNLDFQLGDALRSSLTRRTELEQERASSLAPSRMTCARRYLHCATTWKAWGRAWRRPPEKAPHYITICKEKANALKRLIANLFDYSRLEYLEQAPHRAPMDFGRLVTHSVDDMRLRAEAKGISFSIEGPPASGDVNADWSLLARALTNLLDNALHYTPAGGHISIKWRQQSGVIQFSITDLEPGSLD